MKLGATPLAPINGKHSTMPNRFEQVDDVQPDAITLVLEQRIDGRWAKVHCPASAHAALQEDKTSQSMAPKDALASAVKLANDLKLAIVVVDPDGGWKQEWGELYRWSDEADAL
jgi:hypothetical protein